MNGKTATIVQIIIQAGAVGIALVTVFLFFKFASNHVAHNTEVMIRVEETSKVQISATQDLTEVIRDLNAIIK